MLKVTQRQVIGEFYKTLEQDIGASWVKDLSNYFTSDQASEEYAWLGMSPVLREWVGGRNAIGFRESSQTIINKHYEATIDVLVRDLRRDKTGQILVRIAEMARRANAHWAKMLSEQLILGPTTTCYDGQYFFDTDHSEGDSGTQSNDINSDISTYPNIKSGSTTVPSVEDMQYSIVAGINAILGFKDDQGQPMNEGANEFLAMVPPSFNNAAQQAVATPTNWTSTQQSLEALKQDGMKVRAVANTRLAAWTTSFAVFRIDSNLKALIRQEETKVQMKVKGAGSEYEFDNDAHQYGIDTWRNVGFGMWQNACYVTLT